MEGQAQPMEPRKQRTLLRVSAALPELDNNTLIDALEAVSWDGGEVMRIMGVVDLPLQTIGSEEDWPALAGARPFHSSNGESTNSFRRGPNSGSGTPECPRPMPISPPSTPTDPQKASVTSLSIRFKTFLPNYSFYKKILQAELKNEANKELLHTVYSSSSKLLVLMRGVPGAGKSSLAKVVLALADHGVILSADQFFEDSRGNYKFNPAKLSSAHEKTQARCLEAMQEAMGIIIIDNTNTEAREMCPYVSMALAHDYKIRLLEPSTPWKYDSGRLAVMNTHGVPQKKIKDMVKRFNRTITVDQLIKMSPSNGVKVLHPADLSSSKPGHNVVNTSSCENVHRTSSTSANGMPCPLDTSFQNESSVTRQESCNNSALGYHHLFVDINSTIAPLCLPAHVHSGIGGQGLLVPNAYMDSSTFASEDTTETDCDVETRLVDDIRKLLTDESSSATELSADSTPLPSPSEQDDSEPSASATASEVTETWRPQKPIQSEQSMSIMREEANLLQRLFPSAETLYLDDLFQKSHGNLAWCVDVLINGGYEQEIDFDNQRVTTLEFTPSGNIISMEGKKVNGLHYALPATSETTAPTNRHRKRSQSEKGQQSPGLLASISTRSFPRPNSSSSAMSLQKTCSYNDEYGQRRTSLESFTRPQQDQTSSPLAHHQGFFHQSFPDLYEPIDGDDWVELNCDPKFVTTIKRLYESEDGELEGKGIGQRIIKIPPTLAFEIYKYVRLNEVFHSNDVGSSDAEGGVALHTQDTTLAFQLTVGKLKDEFPNLSEFVIRSAHSTHDGRYDKTKAYLRDMYHPPLFQPCKAPEHDVYTNNSAKNVARRKSTTGFEVEGIAELEGAVGGIGISEVPGERDFQQLRELVTYHHNRKAEFRRRTAEVPKQQGGGVAEYYRQEASKHARFIHDATEELKAKVRTKAQQIALLGVTVLDLHFLFVQEAVAALESFLGSWKDRLLASRRRSVVLKIVTGRGNNSEGRAPKIKPAVINYLSATAQRKSEYLVTVLGGLVMVTLESSRINPN